MLSPVPCFFYALPLKYCSQHLLLITFRPLSQSLRLRIETPYVWANAFLQRPSPIRPDTISLSIVEESAVFVHKVRHRNTIEICQSFCHLRRDMLCYPALDVNVYRACHPSSLCDLNLSQSPAVPAPAEPVRYIINVLVPAIAPNKLLCFPQPARSVEGKTMDI